MKCCERKEMYKGSKFAHSVFLLIPIISCLLLCHLRCIQGQMEFSHEDDVENRKKTKVADEETSANGPFALIDAAPLEDGTIEKKHINNEWFILRKRMSWGEAMVACEEAKAHLVVLPTEEKAKALVKEIAANVTDPIDEVSHYDRRYHEVEFGPDRRYWVALTDQLLEGEWRWASFGLELFYDFWYPGQPDHLHPGKKSEHCVSLWNPGYYQPTGINTHQFNDEPCTNKYYPICGTVNPVAEYNRTYLLKK